jgi:hypothetical protein
MTLKAFLTLTNHSSINKLSNLKAAQFASYVEDYPEIGEMNAFTWFRAAFKQINCPGCAGRQIDAVGCRYCWGTGEVDFHLVAHPMNVYHEAIRMEGKPPDVPR